MDDYLIPKGIDGYYPVCVFLSHIYSMIHLG